jgi:DHA1 family multidrug resistance protein-like MFS transporter
MASFLRSSVAGQFLRWVTGKKVLKYREERDDFQLPACYADSTAPKTLSRHEPVDRVATQGENGEEKEGAARIPSSQIRVDTDSYEELLSRRDSLQLPDSNALSKVTTRSELRSVHTQVDLERLYTAATHNEELKNLPSRPIAPTKSSDGTILVSWYTTDDSDNPQNWSSHKKILVAFQI